MKNSFIDNLISGSYSLVLHIVLVALFVIGMDSASTPRIVSPPKVDIVQATVIDEAQVEQEIANQKASEDKKRLAEQDRQKQVEKQLEDTKKELALKEKEREVELERKRIAEQQRKLEEDRKLKAEQERKIEEQRKHKAEQQRKLEEQRQRDAEQERKAEEERKQKAQQERQAEEEKRRLAEADRKAEEKRKKEAEDARKVEEERKRKAEQERIAEEKRKTEAERKAQIAEADQLLQEGLAAEQREQEARRVAGVVDQYAVMIEQRIKRYWIRPASSQNGLQCTLQVSLMPGGDVKQVTVVKSSGNDIFDRSAESAVYKAAPLPQPTDPKAAATLRDFQFIFKPE